MNTIDVVDLAAVVIGFCLLCAVWIFFTETLKGVRRGQNRVAMAMYRRWWQR